MSALKLATRWLAAVFGLCLLCIVLVAMFFNPNAYRNELQQWLGQQIGRPFTLQGELQWRWGSPLLLTLPPMRVEESASHAAFASWQQLRLSISLWPLLIGQIKLGAVELRGLRLNLRRGAHGDNWQDVLARLTRESAPSRWQFAGVGNLTLLDAELGFDDAISQSMSVLQISSLRASSLQREQPFSLKVQAHLSQRSATQTLDLPFDLALRGQLKFESSLLLRDWQASGQLDFHDTQHGMHAERMPLTLSIAALHWDGRMQRVEIAALRTMLGTAQLHGELRASLAGVSQWSGALQVTVPQLRAELRNWGVALPMLRDASVLQNFTVQLQAGGNAQQLQLQIPRLQLDQSTLSGSAVLTLGDKPQYEFALNADQLNLDRYLPVANQGQLSKNQASQAAPVPIAWLRTLQAQGTLQIDRAHLNGIDAQNLRIELGQ